MADESGTQHLVQGGTVGLALLTEAAVPVRSVPITLITLPMIRSRRDI